jgi:membrane protein
MANTSEPNKDAAPERGSRGRHADKPSDIPKRGWKDILKRTKKGLAEDHVTIVAGGVAFFALLGSVPAIAATISIYGLIADPAQVEQQFASVRHMMPAEAYELLRQQMHQIASAETAAGLGAVIGIALALWGGAKAMGALMDGLNITYNEQEKRGFFKLNGTALLLTLAAVVGVVIMVGLIAVLPAVLDRLALGQAAQTWVSILRWPLLLAFFMFGLTMLYRFGPSRDKPQWRWVSWGAVGATLIWLAASALFSLYVANFDSYNKTYGSLGTIVILLMWFYISAYCVLLGAELNAEMERQTEKDSTVGHPEPRGERGAFSADNIGEAQT